MVPRVITTPKADFLIDQLISKFGDIIFHQSGGCCDGSAPMCYEKHDFLLGDQDVLLGRIRDIPFYIGIAQFNYWHHTQLIIDVVPGHGGMFSLENGSGKRFLTRSRVFSTEEFMSLPIIQAF